MLARLIIVFFVFFPGCANQATVVELEDYTEKLELNQKNLLDRIEFLEGQSRNPSVHVRSQQAFSASLVAQLSDIEANVREFTGRVDEADHKVSILNNKVDTESFRTRVLLERLVKLERQIAKLNIKGSTPKLGKKEKTPGSTQLLKPKRKKNRPVFLLKRPTILRIMTTSKETIPLQSVRLMPLSSSIRNPS